MNKRTIFGATLVALLLIVFGAISSTQPVFAQVSSWEASYFDNPNLQGRPLVKTFESSIHHEWGNNAPPVSPGMPNDSFSVRWIGQIVEDTGQEYRIVTRADDNIRIWVNADLVVNKWDAYAGAQTVATFGLGRGTHTIRVEYRDWGFNAFAHVDIAPTSQAVGDQPTAPPPPPPSSAEGDCIIPESGPWPPCATGGDGGAQPPAPPPAPAPTTPPPAADPAPAPAPPAVNNGLIAYYAFNEASGNQAFDAANNNTGFLNEAVSRIGGPSGSAIRINSGGSFSAAATGANAIGQSDFSVAFWMRTSASSGVQRIFDKRTASPNIGYHMFVWDGNLGMQIADGNGESVRCGHDVLTTQCTNYISNRFVADGNWHYVVATVDRDQGDGLKFYVDGVLAQSMNPTDRQGSINPGGAGAPLVMDAQGATLDMDEFRLYGRVLNSGEITQLFNTR